MPVCGQNLNGATRSGVPPDRPRRTSRATAGSWLWPVLTALLILVGCSEQDQTLQLQDLDPGEKLYVTRMVTLERAKAVALVDSTCGNSLLDSLALAWGDSSLTQARTAATKDPTRSQLVNQLLLDILSAEQDSLTLAPWPDRLDTPLPEFRYRTDHQPPGR